MHRSTIENLPLASRLKNNDSVKSQTPRASVVPNSETKRKANLIDDLEKFTVTAYVARSAYL